MKKTNNIIVHSHSLKRRITSAFLAAFWLLQICAPTVAAASEIISKEALQTKVQLDFLSQLATAPVSTNYMYTQAAYMGSGGQNAAQVSLESFYAATEAAKKPIGAMGKLIGDPYVQARLIRSQIYTLLDRNLIDTALYNSETSQISALYKNAQDFLQLRSDIKLGDVLYKEIDRDMIWPEIRFINGENVWVPVVYLSDATIAARKLSGNEIAFGDETVFNDFIVGNNTSVQVRGKYLAATNSITNFGTITNGPNNQPYELFAGILNNLSGNIFSGGDLSIFANQVVNKTVLIPYRDKNGSGNRFGSIANISADGNLKITSYGDITFQGATANAGGYLTFDAKQNINIVAQEADTQTEYQSGHWRVNESTLDLLQSRLTADNTIKLIANGTISITASELHSTKGGIELLAKHGIYIADEQGHFQSNRVDKIGKTKGTGSDFESFAIRSVLSAGKGILLATDSGDITLQGAKITSAEGTEVKASDGKVRLLITKENSQHYLDTVRKGMWTIKTVHEEYLEEKGIPNAIVGGLAVEALLGVDIEYAGRAGVNLKDQIDEYAKMSDTKWMADIYEGRTLFKNAQGNLVPLNQIVDFSKVDLAYKYVREHNTSLSPAAMAIIAICVAVALGGSGAGLIGTGEGAIGGTAATAAGTASLSVSAVAMQAGVLTLATSAAQNLAAGKSLEDTLKAMTTEDALKNLAISMATAGALNQLGDLELFNKAQVSATPQLAFVNQAFQAVTNSVITAGISVTINGGNSEDYRNAFKTSLATSAINTIGQTAFDEISNGSWPKAAKWIANLSVGCVGAALTARVNDGDQTKACYSAAGGVAITQFAIDQASNLVNQVSSDQSADSFASLSKYQKFMKDYGIDASKIVAAFTALALGGDVNAAADSASSLMRANAQKFSSAYTLYSQVVGEENYGKENFQEIMEAKYEALTIAELRAVKAPQPVIDEIISKSRSNEIFSGAALSDSILWDNGKNISKAVEDKAFIRGNENNSSTPSEQVDGVEVVVVSGIRNPSFNSSVVKFGVSTKEFINDLSPLAKQFAGVTLNVATGGAIKTFFSYGASKITEVALPDSIKSILESAPNFEKIAGNGFVVLATDLGYGDVDELNKSGNQYTDLGSDGLGWIATNVLGIAGIIKGGNPTKHTQIVNKHVEDKNARDIQRESDDLCNCAVGNCFAASTLVKTEKGLVEIEKVKKGDLVASKDEKTHAIAWKPVTQLFQYDDDRTTFELVVQRENGLPETFEVTNNHPFYVLDTGWVDSGNLKQGMKLTSYKNNIFEVKSLTPLDRSPVTYNFEVADFHTYFVGSSEVWVHNTGGCACTAQVTVNRVYHNQRQADAHQEFENAGLNSVNEVTILAADGKTRARADLSIEGQRGGAANIPAGFEAYDINGNRLTAIPLDHNGRALVEVKTGNAELSQNQRVAYADAARGDAQGRGGNAGKALFNGRPAPESVVVIFDTRQ